MKKIFALLLALVMVLSLAACGSSNTASSGGSDAGAAKKIAILVPNADHGWTGAVMTYAEEKAAEINAAG